MNADPEKHIEQYNELLESLNSLGFKMVNYSQSESFGNFYAGFSNGKLLFYIVRDRSQLFLEGNRDELESYGLCQAFDDSVVFQETLLRWIRKKL